MIGIRFFQNREEAVGEKFCSLLFMETERESLPNTVIIPYMPIDSQKRLSTISLVPSAENLISYAEFRKTSIVRKGRIKDYKETVYILSRTGINKLEYEKFVAEKDYFSAAFS